MKRLTYILTIAIGVMLSACNGQGTTATHEEGEDHHREGETIELTLAQMEAVGIKIGTMERRAMSATVETSGSLEVAPANRALVSPGLPGTVTRLLVVPGQRVSRGEIVAYIDAPEVLALRREYAESMQAMENARRELERQEALAARGAGVRRNLENARSEFMMAETAVKNVGARMGAYGVSGAGGESGSYPVKAEIGGTVVSVNATIGSYADRQSPVAEIVNNEAVYCMIRLSERYAGVVKPGMETEMRLTSDPSVRFTGKVADVTPALDPQTRTLPVKVDITAPAPDLIPGMAVSAMIEETGEETDALPEGAVVSSGGKSYIFVLEDSHEEDGETAYHFEKREVVAGRPSFGYVGIRPLEPLESDVKIVTAGAFYLNSMSTEHGEHNH